MMKFYILRQLFMTDIAGQRQSITLNTEYYIVALSGGTIDLDCTIQVIEL